MKNKLKLLVNSMESCYYLSHVEGINSLKKHIAPTNKITYSNKAPSILSIPTEKARQKKNRTKYPNNLNIVSSKIKFIVSCFYWNIIKKRLFFKENNRWLMI